MRLIKVSALWCPACLITNKAVNKLIDENKDIELISLDYDFDEEEVKKYDIGKVLPVLIFEKDNKEVLRLIGEKNYEEIKEAVGGIK